MMNLFSRLPSFVLFMACLVASYVSAQELKWEQLFNGRDLQNWTPKVRSFEVGENYRNTFRVNDGLLQVRYDGYDEFKEYFGHLFYNESFSHYLLAVEYRFVGEQVPQGPAWAFRNSGVMIHGEDPEDMRVEQAFPVSIEVQLLGGNGQDERPTANVCTPGTKYKKNGKVVEAHCAKSSSATFHGDQWVRVEVLVLGDSVIRHFVNGEEVLYYESPQTDDGQLLSQGTISLQGESHPIDFRKVEIVDFSPYKDNQPKLQQLATQWISEKRIPN